MSRALLGLAGLVLLVVAAFFAAVPILIQRNLSAEEVARRASELSGRLVKVEDVGLAFRPGLRIRAEGVAIEGAGSAEAVEVEIALLPLLRRRVEPSELHLRGARLLVERSPSGGLRVLLLHRPGSEGPAEGGGVPALPALEARDGALVLVGADRRAPDAPVVRIRRLRQGAIGPGGGSARLRLDVAVEPAEDRRWSLGEARLDAGLRVDEGRIRLESGRLEGRELVARGLRVDRFEARFAFADGTVEVESLELSGYGGDAAASGRVRLTGDDRFEGRIDASELDLGAMVADWRGRAVEPPPGRLAIEGALERLDPDPLRGAGQGRLALRDGALPARSLFDALLGSLGRLTGRLLSVGGAVSPAPSRLESLTATWTLRDDRAHSDDLEVLTDDYQYRAQGSLGFDRSLDFRGRLQLTSRGVQRLLASGALPLPAATSVLPEIPVRVAGSLGAPSVTASATSLPAAAQGTLAGLVGGAGGIVKGAAQVGKGAAKAGKDAIEGVLGR